jgi:hypothetical protein
VSDGATLGETGFSCVYIGNIFKIFSGTTGPEKLKFTSKFSGIAQKQVF